MTSKINKILPFVIFIILMSLMGFPSRLPNNISSSVSLDSAKENQTMFLSDLTHHDQIIIDNDTDFAEQASNEGWDGDGSSSQPYIIENYLINGSVAKQIWILNTRAHFVIQHCELRNARSYAIELYNVSNGKFTANLITHSQNGIFGYNVSSLIVEGNTIIDNHEEGVFLEVTYNDAIENNTISNHTTGIIVHVASDSTIYNNSITLNKADGLELHDANNITVTVNNISDSSDFGINIHNSPQNTILDNTLVGCGFGFDFGYTIDSYRQKIVTGNSVNGKGLAYYQDITGLTVPSSIDVGQIALINCTDVEIQDQDLSNSSVGIYLIYSKLSVIKDIYIGNNSWSGIRMYESHNNTLDSINAVECRTEEDAFWSSCVYIYDSQNNTFSNSVFSGNEAFCFLFDNAHGTIVDSCEISNNGKDGFYIVYSSNITMFNNSITFNGGKGIDYLGSGARIESNILYNNTEYGIYLADSDFNIVKNNLCANNTIDVAVHGSDSNVVTNNTLFGGFRYSTRGLEMVGGKHNQIVWNEFMGYYWFGSYPDPTWEDNFFDFNYYFSYSGTDLNQDGIGDSEVDIGDGSIDYHPVMLPRNSSPIFLEPLPSELAVNDSLELDLVATARPPGIDYWWISDTTHFSIDDFGVITNTSEITPGTYEIEVRAYDYEVRFCSANIRITFSLTPEPTPTTPTSSSPPSYESVIMMFAIVGGIAAVIFVVLIYRKNQIGSERNTS